MPEADPALEFLLPLEENGLAYMATGSFAVSVFGEPRMTHDVDIILMVRPGDIEKLLESFGDAEAFYCPPKEVLIIEAKRESHGHANLISLKTGFKADLYFIGNDPLHLWAYRKRQMVEIESRLICLAPPEYVIVRKLEFFRSGESSKHLKDIRSILDCYPDLDLAEVEAWCRQRGLSDLWARVNSPFA